MKLRAFGFGVIVAVVLGAVFLSRRTDAQIAINPQSLRPENLRFRVIGNEPISGGNTIVPNTQVWVIKDTKSLQCYTLFFIGNSGSVTGPAACPE
jgi:hypothetical protein